MQMIKKYWWIIAAVVLYMFMGKKKKVTRKRRRPSRSMRPMRTMYRSMRRRNLISRRPAARRMRRR